MKEGLAVILLDLLVLEHQLVRENDHLKHERIKRVIRMVQKLLNESV